MLELELVQVLHWWLAAERPLDKFPFHCLSCTHLHQFAKRYLSVLLLLPCQPKRPCPTPCCDQRLVLVPQELVGAAVSAYSSSASLTKVQHITVAVLD